MHFPCLLSFHSNVNPVCNRVLRRKERFKVVSRRSPCHRARLRALQCSRPAFGRSRGRRTHERSSVRADPSTRRLEGTRSVQRADCEWPRFPCLDPLRNATWPSSSSPQATATPASHSVRGRSTPTSTLTHRSLVVVIAMSYFGVVRVVAVVVVGSVVPITGKRLVE